MDGRAAAPSPENVLIIRPSALGAVCRSVPILVSLRAALPGSSVELLNLGDCGLGDADKAALRTAWAAAGKPEGGLHL